MQNDLKKEKEFVEIFNKPNEAIKYSKKLLRSPRSNNDTSRLGYISTKEGESSKNLEERNNKGKNSKPMCHNCGKKGHTTNVCRSKIVDHNVKHKSMVHYHKYNKQGHQAHECRTKTMHKQIFEGYCYNCQKYGHRDFECKSKPMWSSNKQTKVRNNGKSYNWDYNTRYSYHYCQEYGHVPENCIRTHFSGSYKRWLNQTTCSSCLKTGHISRYCPIRSKEPSCEFNKGKGKEDIENVQNKMNKTWNRKDD